MISDVFTNRSWAENRCFLPFVRRQVTSAYQFNQNFMNIYFEHLEITNFSNNFPRSVTNVLKQEKNLTSH